MVPTGAGAATDIMARLLANGISSGLGQTVVVENKPGASGLLAHQAVARAQPDGYTLLFTNTSGMSINPVTFKTLPYDPGRDFTAIAMVCRLGPQMLSVNAELPVNTVPGFFDYARAHRGIGIERRMAKRNWLKTIRPDKAVRYGTSWPALCGKTVLDSPLVSIQLVPFYNSCSGSGDYATLHPHLRITRFRLSCRRAELAGI